MGKNQHVVPVGDKWGIKGEGNVGMSCLFAINTIVNLVSTLWLKDRWYL